MSPKDRRYALEKRRIVEDREHAHSMQAPVSIGLDRSQSDAPGVE
jgi:hypothetical protein